MLPNADSIPGPLSFSFPMGVHIALSVTILLILSTIYLKLLTAVCTFNFINCFAIDFISVDVPPLTSAFVGAEESDIPFGVGFKGLTAM